MKLATDSTLSPRILGNERPVLITTDTRGPNCGQQGPSPTSVVAAQSPSFVPQRTELASDPRRVCWVWWQQNFYLLFLRIRPFPFLDDSSENWRSVSVQSAGDKQNLQSGQAPAAGEKRTGVASWDVQVTCVKSDNMRPSNHPIPTRLADSLISSPIPHPPVTVHTIWRRCVRATDTRWRQVKLDNKRVTRSSFTSLWLSNLSRRTGCVSGYGGVNR